MTKLFVLVSATLLSFVSAGCSASWVQQRNGPPAGGVIRYMAAGIQFLDQSRRQDADEKMAEFCDGAYRVVMERDDGIEANYRYVTFRCI